MSIEEKPTVNFEGELHLRRLSNGAFEITCQWTDYDEEGVADSGPPIKLSMSVSREAFAGEVYLEAARWLGDWGGLDVWNKS